MMASLTAKKKAGTAKKPATTSPMSRLYRRLADAGINRAYVRKKALPDWWEDEIAQNPAGLAQAITILSRNLGIEIASLQNDSSQVTCMDFGRTKLKKGQQVSEDTLKWPKCISARAATLASLATANPIADIPASAHEIRNLILRTGVKWIDLDALLDFCWNVGIPVLHVPEFPEGTTKMDGLSVKINGRPAIVISKRMKFSAWLLFILAHELGHITRGHLEGNDVLVDERVNGNDTDQEESQANTFACELLTGRRDTHFYAKSNLTAETLARQALRIGRAEQIDPGAIALNYAWNRDFIRVANAALNLLEPDAKAVEKIHSKMAGRLNWDQLPDDSREFLIRVTRP